MSWPGKKRTDFFPIFIQQNKSVNYNDRSLAKKLSTKSIKLIKNCQEKKEKLICLFIPVFLLLCLLSTACWQIFNQSNNS